MARKKRRRISLGTLIMLLMTLLVIAGCAGFMIAISGGTLDSRAGEAMSMVEEHGVLLMDEEEAASLARQEAMHTPQPTPQSTAQAPASPTPPVEEVRTFTLAAAGTIYAPRAIREGADGGAGEYDFDAVFAGLGSVLSEVDFAVATLETTTAGEKKGYGNFNAPAQLLDALRGCGLDLLSIATERAFDKGDDGLQITLSELTTRGLTAAGMRSAGGRTEMINIGGVQTAVLAYTYGFSSEGESAASEEERGAVCVIDTQQMIQDIRQARADGAHVVIVMPHWGTKNKQETPEDVRRMALELAQAGADVILGAHPNVVQGTQRLRVVRADGLEYESVVCYSLGSLLSDARADENTAGMIARMQISYDPQTRRASVGDLACVPVYIARQESGGGYVYRVVDVDNTAALETLDEAGREAAMHAAERVREVTGQSDVEGEGQG